MVSQTKKPSGSHGPVFFPNMVPSNCRSIDTALDFLGETGSSFGFPHTQNNVAKSVYPPHLSLLFSFSLFTSSGCRLGFHLFWSPFFVLEIRLNILAPFLPFFLPLSFFGFLFGSPTPFPLCSRAKCFILFPSFNFNCSQMAVPLYGITLKCAKCGVVSSAEVSATATSNAMLVPLISTSFLSPFLLVLSPPPPFLFCKFQISLSLPFHA